MSRCGFLDNMIWFMSTQFNYVVQLILLLMRGWYKKTLWIGQLESTASYWNNRRTYQGSSVPATRDLIQDSGVALSPRLVMMAGPIPTGIYTRAVAILTFAYKFNFNSFPSWFLSSLSWTTVPSIMVLTFDRACLPWNRTVGAGRRLRCCPRIVLDVRRFFHLTVFYSNRFQYCLVVII